MRKKNDEKWFRSRLAGTFGDAKSEYKVRDLSIFAADDEQSERKDQAHLLPSQSGSLPTTPGYVPPVDYITYRPVPLLRQKKTRRWFRR